MQYLFIEPKKRESAQNRKVITTTPSGQKISERPRTGNAQSFSILVNPKTKKLNSGLDYFVPNNWQAKSEKEAKLPSSWAGSDIWKKDSITKQEELELKYNRPPGFLTADPKSNRREYTYLQTFTIRLEDGVSQFDLSTLDGEITLAVAKASKFIANSREEAESSPIAMYYISKVNEAEQNKAADRRVKAKGNASVVNVYEKLGAATAKKMAVILEIGTTELSDEAVEIRIYDYINHEKKYLRNIKEFDALAQMAGHKVKKKEFETRYLLRELANKGVLFESKGAFYWQSKRGTSLEEIGKTYNEALRFLLDPERAPYVEELKQELKTKGYDY